MKVSLKIVITNLYTGLIGHQISVRILTILFIHRKHCLLLVKLLIKKKPDSTYKSRGENRTVGFFGYYFYHSVSRILPRG